MRIVVFAKGEIP